MSKKYKTTEAHFKIFKAECEYWVDRFSLRSWIVYYEHRDNPEVRKSLAWYEANLKGRLITIGLSKDWESLEIINPLLCRTGFHEVCELLLARLEMEAMVDTCPTQKADIEEHKHAIIRRLEYAVWLPDWEARKK